MFKKKKNLNKITINTKTTKNRELFIDNIRPISTLNPYQGVRTKKRTAFFTLKPFGSAQSAQCLVKKMIGWSNGAISLLLLLDKKI